ncbi:E4 ORFF [Bovine mastadenovirus A]|uniref:E4 ORFF n=1 Tax=Bovine mastadenovirus A TaxID=129953 RepID=UPI0000443F9C|nr:E4 ORFF [Bovine mastadenovirus A]
MQLKLFVYTGPDALAPILKSDNEVWLLAPKKMVFLPYGESDFCLDHEVFIPPGYDFSVSCLVPWLYADITHEPNLIKNIVCKMYEWVDYVIYANPGEPVVKISIEKKSLSE